VWRSDGRAESLKKFSDHTPQKLKGVYHAADEVLLLSEGLAMFVMGRWHCSPTTLPADCLAASVQIWTTARPARRNPAPALGRTSIASRDACVWDRCLSRLAIDDRPQRKARRAREPDQRPLAGTLYPACTCLDAIGTGRTIQHARQWSPKTGISEDSLDKARRKAKRSSKG